MTATDKAQRVADNIRAEVARRRLSQVKLAEQVGIRQQALSRRLTGSTPFRIDELARIAEVLDIPLAELVAA